MKKRFVPLLVVLVLFTLLISPVFAQTPLREKLEAKGYHRVNLFPDFYDTWEFSEDTPISISHGFATDDPWSAMSGSDKAAFMSKASFELTIDDGKESWSVRLRRFQWIADEDDTYPGYMYIIFWVTFPSNTFKAGTYTFTGTWSCELYDTLIHYATITVLG